ncbi:MAG: sodium:proton antiporter [Spirochaetaceae bacterium]|jgi:multicomponent Na+:H+ antiporter subunit C|nr:sodium:proton antiporter [Spirochaetaceae bacterium]
MIERILLALLFLAGFFGLITRRNLIKKVYALSIMNMAVLLLFNVEGGRIGKHAPFMQYAEDAQSYVDPLPQALMLTAIVVGVCISIVALTLAYRLFREHRTLDCEELREKIHEHK